MVHSNPLLFTRGAEDSTQNGWVAVYTIGIINSIGQQMDVVSNGGGWSGLWMSYNYGITWSLNEFSYWKMFVDITSDSSGKYLALVTSDLGNGQNGVYYSTDNGKTLRTYIDLGGFCCIASNEYGSKLIAGTCYSKIAISTDHGASWSYSTHIGIVL